MAARVRDTLFGEMVIRARLCTHQQVGECLDVQEELRKEGKDVPKLGEILAEKRYLNTDQYQAVLREHLGRQEGRFGEVAVRLRFCFTEGVDKALEKQAQLAAEKKPHRRIGELLVEESALEALHVGAVLGAMGLSAETCPACKKQVNLAEDDAERKCPECGAAVPRAGVEIIPAEKPAPLPEAPAAAPEEGSRILEAARQEKAAEFGGYQITAKLGANAAGGLYLARKGDDGPPVTLKIFSGELSSRKDFVKDFAAAAKQGSRLKHGAINRVLDVGRDRGRVYCASEYVKGRSLRYLLEKQGRLKSGLALSLARQTAEALAYAHSQGVVHGDLKPSNIIVGPDTAVKIANFGVVSNPLHNLLALSKLSETVPIYAAPELAAKGAAPTVKSDVYSLGAVLYHMLAGRAPFEAASPLQTLQRLAEEELQPPSAVVKGIPENVEKVVVAMLAVEPRERHADMAALIEDLKDLGAPEPPEPKPSETVAAQQAKAEEAAAEAELDPEVVAQKSAARKRMLVGILLAAVVGMFFVALALVLVFLAPAKPALPDVKALPEAPADAPDLGPRRGPEKKAPPENRPRRPIGG